MNNPQETCPVRGTGSPENPEVATLVHQFDELIERTRRLQGEADAWKRQACFARDPGTKARLVRQSQRIQSAFAALATDHARLQAANVRLQARAMDEREDPHGTQSS